MTEPPAGTVVLSRIRGFVGVLIKIGQLLNGDASEYTHALLSLGDGTAIAAYPGGARIVSLSGEEIDHGPLGYVEVPLTDDQRAKVVEIARSFLGTGYGWLDYLVLAAVRLGIPSDKLRAYVASTHTMICSQMIDEIFQCAKIHLFKDGRPSGDVTPGDLAELALERSY